MIRERFFAKAVSLHLLMMALALVARANPGEGKASLYSIADYGASARQGFLNTLAIQSAIDHCAAAGGGTVVIPPGVYTTGAIFFKSNVALRLEEGATLKGSVNAKDYPQVKTRWEGKEREWISALVNFIDVDHATVSGPGTIDGSGDVWTAQDPRRPAKNSSIPEKGAAAHPADLVTRMGHPRLIAFQNCHGVDIENVHVKNEASWGVFFLYCQDVVAKNIQVRAEHNIPSSDGMDIDSCRNVLVTGCDFDVNDDDISIKSGKDEEGRRINRPSENITIEHTRFGYGHGGVAIGSEVSGGIRNIEVRDCVVEADNWAPIRIKSQPSRGGLIENITYKDIDIKDARQAVEINLAWRMVGPAEPPAPKLTRMKNVRFINIHGRVRAAGSILGLAEAPVTGVTFENCRLTTGKELKVSNAVGIDLSGLRIEASTTAAHAPPP